MSEQKNKPVHEVRIRSIKAAVWRNNGAGRVFYSVTFEKLYKDGEDWKSTSSFGTDDLLVLAKVADQAHTWVVQQSGSNQE